MATPATLRAWESQFLFYRVHWKTNVVGAFIQPFLYLLGMGVGVGSLIDGRAGSADRLGGLTYYEFLAPALLATTGMMAASGEALWPTMAGFKWQRFFHSQAQTPLTPRQIAGGTALWHATRAAITVTAVAIVLAGFPGSRSWGLLPAIPFGVLTGVAFSTPLLAWAATRETERSFPNIMRFAVTPLFLFGGSFFPITELPGWLQVVAKCTPLWHGVELCRGSVHHTLSLTDALVHVGVLAGFAVAGYVCAVPAFRKRLSK